MDIYQVGLMQFWPLPCFNYEHGGLKNGWFLGQNQVTMAGSVWGRNSSRKFFSTWNHINANRKTWFRAVLTPAIPPWIDSVGTVPEKNSRGKFSGHLKSSSYCKLNFDATYLLWTVIPKGFQGPALQSENIPKIVQNFGSFWCFFLDEVQFHGQTVDFFL